MPEGVCASPCQTARGYSRSTCTAGGSDGRTPCMLHPRVDRAELLGVYRCRKSTIIQASGRCSACTRRAHGNCANAAAPQFRRWQRERTSRKHSAGPSPNLPRQAAELLARAAAAAASAMRVAVRTHVSWSDDLLSQGA